MPHKLMFIYNKLILSGEKDCIKLHVVLVWLCWVWSCIAGKQAVCSAHSLLPDFTQHKIQTEKPVYHKE